MKRNCLQRIIKLDIYKEPINLWLPDGEKYYRTVTGSILSVITISIVSLYAIYKLSDLLEMNEYKI